MRSALVGLIAGRAIEAPSAVSAEDRQRLAALGYVGTQSSSPTQPGSTLPDPKDMAPVLQKYREAVDLLEARQFAAGADALAAVLKDNPGMTDVWLQYAGVLTKLGRDADALRAYQQVIRLKPAEPAGLLGATTALIALGRLDEATQHAELAAKSSPATAHENLAQIALARKDFAEAERQAALAGQADPQLPLPVYVRGLIQYHQQRYVEAVPLLLQARDAWSARTIQTPDLRFYLGDALAKLERYPEAENAFLEELRIFPGSVRARAGLALLYQATGKTDRVERIIDDMMRVAPSPRTYETAAELWRIFGHPDRAAAVRAAARSRFGAGSGR